MAKTAVSALLESSNISDTKILKFPHCEKEVFFTGCTICKSVKDKILISRNYNLLIEYSNIYLMQEKVNFGTIKASKLNFHHLHLICNLCRNYFISSLMYEVELRISHQFIIRSTHFQMNRAGILDIGKGNIQHY